MTVTLRGMTWEHERGHGSVSAAAEAYREVRDGVVVEWEYRSLLAFGDQHIEEMARDHDLMVIDHPHVPQAVEQGLLARLDGVGHDDDLAALAEQSVGLSHSSYQYRGGQWGLATDAAAHVSAHRPDLVSAPPASWPEVLELARDGRVVWPYKPVDAWSSLITVAAGNGEEAMRASGVFLSAEAMEEAMGTLRRLAELVPDDNATWNPIRALEALASDDGFAYSPLLFGYTNYSRAGYRAHRVKFADIPRSRRGVNGALLAGAGIAVSAFSKHLPEAVEHAFWLASPDVQRGVYYAGGGQPGYAPAWDDDALNADSLDFFRGTRASVEGAYLRPRHPGYIDLQNELGQAVTRALQGELSDAQLKRTLDDGVERWMS